MTKETWTRIERRNGKTPAYVAEIAYNVRVVVHGGLLTICTQPDDKVIAILNRQEAAKRIR